MTEPPARFGFASDRVRVAVRCVLKCGGRYLFLDLRDDEDPFVIPPGGGMEYGEHSRDTAIREIREELGVDVEVAYLGVSGNHFTHRGKRGHDIEFLYIADVDSEAMAAVGKTATESDGSVFALAWFSLAELEALNATVAPVGIVEMLRR